MDNKDLIWTLESSREVLHTPVFDVMVQTEVAPNGMKHDYVAMNAPDWVMVIPELGGEFITVRQWRHSAMALSTEFPGGVVDSGESPREAAERELLEETGFKVGRLTHLGTVNPNPALFTNHVHFYLAEELTATGVQSLDDDELVDYTTVPVQEVIASYGGGEYRHALMGAALAFYFRHRYISKERE